MFLKRFLSVSNNKKKKELVISNKKSAFTFIELAVVIAILGVLVAGVLAGSKIIEKSRLATARNLTKNAPVNTVDSLFAWYESTTSDSLLESESEEGSSLSEWKDIKLNRAALDATQSNTSYQPEFSGEINHLTTVKFDGSGKYFDVDATNLNNIEYTIMVVEKRASGDSDNYFIGDSSITDDNENILLGYSSSGEVTHSQGGSNSYTSAVSSYSDSDGETRIFTFIQSSSLGKKTYINGYLAGESSDTDKVSNLSNLIIGKDYNGEIGEVIIFNKALSNRDRNNVEQYLGQKWSVEITEASTSCTNGIVTSGGCEAACSVSIPGVSETSVQDGASSSFTCSVTGYDSNDTVSYSCSNGILSSSGSCGCDTAGGYADNGGSCEKQCALSGIEGISDTTVSPGSSTVDCDSSGYNGSVSYTCTNGTLSSVSNGCYTESACTASGGSVVDYDSSTKLYVFTAVGTDHYIDCPTSKSVTVLVVAGGGGGSMGCFGAGGAGGGAGELIYRENFSITSGQTSVKVGDGGGASSSCNDNNGGDNGQNGGLSSFANLNAAGGGGGGGREYRGSNGGSGGGAGISGATKAAGSSTASNGFGSSGGKNAISGSYGAGGGGGAGHSGYDATSSGGGNGGEGKDYSSIFGTSYGENGWFAGGGGSGYFGSGYSNGSGGTGGGGAAGSAGMANTGGGGGGGSSASDSGYQGGSGIVIVKDVVNPSCVDTGKTYDADSDSCI